MKKRVTLETTIKALEMMQAGKVITMTPCSVFNPECGNCRLYLLEGMNEWFYKQAIKSAPKKEKKS